MGKSILVALATIFMTVLAASALMAVAYSGTIAMYSGWNFPAEEQSLQYNLVRLIKDAAIYGYKRMDTAVYIVNATESDIAASVTGWGGYLDTVHIYWDSHGLMSSEFDNYWEPHDIFAVIDGSGNTVWDNEIYNYQFTDFHPVKLVVIDACYQGHEIGETFIAQSTQSAWHAGMPQAWLYTTQLSPDGYAAPDGSGRVFIGWYNESPYLSLDLFGTNDAIYKFFVRFFSKLYGYYTLPASNVKDALDSAAQYVTGSTSFDNSPLYKGFTFGIYETKMVVYGDGTYGSGSW